MESEQFNGSQDFWTQGINGWKNGAVGFQTPRHALEETMRKRRLAMERKLSVSGDSSVRPVGLPQMFWTFFVGKVDEIYTPRED